MEFVTVKEHVSVSFPVVKGKCDNELSWPLLGSVTLTLLYQLIDSDHFDKTLMLTETRNVRVRKEVVGQPIRDFIPHSELGYDPVNNIQHLKDETLYFRISVYVDDYKPWLDYAP